VYRIIREDSGIGFDPEVVDALFAMLANQLVRPSRINQELEVAV
jgi:HD-GYP domain-containing protein (c-di-GMP phosphodiesterase class II)